MTANLIDRYRRWFEYEKDAHAKTISSLAAVPDEKRSSPQFQKAVDLFAHVVAARRLWLFRFGVISEGPRELFPRGTAVDSLSPLAEQMQTVWSEYLDRLDAAEIARVFEYRSIDGGRFTNSVEDILTQLFGHSLYHRGQIAQLIRSIDCEPAATDFVFWSRQPLDQAL